MTQNQYRTSVNAYYRHLAGRAQERPQWDWKQVLRGYISYSMLIPPDRSN